jgi:hypothetical protein
VHDCARKCARAVAQHHQRVPTDPGLDLATLASALRLDAGKLRAALEDTPGLVVERGVVRDEAHVTSAAESPEAQALVAALDASPSRTALTGRRRRADSARARARARRRARRRRRL